jgi:hypothetical protein
LHLKTGSGSAGSIHEDVFHGISQTKTVAVVAPQIPFYLSSAEGFKKYAENMGLKWFL